MEIEAGSLDLGLFPDPLSKQRYHYVLDRFKGYQRILDLGSGSCGLAKHALRLPSCSMFEKSPVEFLCIDSDSMALDNAKEYFTEHCAGLPMLKSIKRSSIRVNAHVASFLDLDHLGNIIKEYSPQALCMIEVIEHLHIDLIEKLCSNLAWISDNCTDLQEMIFTTPNQEFNPFIISMRKGQLRHPDHKFEWNRNEFTDWSFNVFLPILPKGWSCTIEPGLGFLDHIDRQVSGPCTQIARFTRSIKPNPSPKPNPRPNIDNNHFSIYIPSNQEIADLHDKIIRRLLIIFKSQEPPSLEMSLIDAWNTIYKDFEFYLGSKSHKALIEIIARSRDLDLSLDENFFFPTFHNG
jgi:hypothetical protein